MKYQVPHALFGAVYSHGLASALSPAVRKEIRSEYRAILSRAKEIGPGNPLLSSYTLAAFFIAMNRCSSRSPEENYALLSDSLYASKLVSLSLGNADQYLSSKKWKKRQIWSQETHKHRYENDWVVDVLPKTETYDLGYDYWDCGACKLCQDEGCPELAHYLCRLDFMLAEKIGLILTRTTTLADGGDHCDFRFKRPAQ